MANNNYIGQNYGISTIGRIIPISGAPVDGTSGTLAGVADKGTIVADTATGNLYVNKGTVASPVWKAITTAA